MKEKVTSLPIVKHQGHEGGKTMITTLTQKEIGPGLAMLHSLTMWSSFLHTGKTKVIGVCATPLAGQAKGWQRCPMNKDLIKGVCTMPKPQRNKGTQCSHLHNRIDRPRAKGVCTIPKPQHNKGTQCSHLHNRINMPKAKGVCTMPKPQRNKGTQCSHLHNRINKPKVTLSNRSTLTLGTIPSSNNSSIRRNGSGWIAYSWTAKLPQETKTKQVTGNRNHYNNRTPRATFPTPLHR